MPESVDIPRGVSSADLLRAQEAARWQEIRNYNEAVKTSQTQRLTDMLNRNAPPPPPSGNAPVGVSGVPDSIPNPYMNQADRASTYRGPSQQSLYRGEIELANDYDAEVARRARAAQAGSGNVAVDAPGGPRPVNTPGGGQDWRSRAGAGAGRLAPFAPLIGDRIGDQFNGRGALNDSAAAARRFYDDPTWENAGDYARRTGRTMGEFTGANDVARWFGIPLPWDNLPPIPGDAPGNVPGGAPDPFKAQGLPPPPPFYGGQAATLYYAQVFAINPRQQSRSSIGRVLHGPIRSIRIDVRNERTYYEILCNGEGAQSRRATPLWITLGDHPIIQNISYEDFSLLRMDGLPDTGGNPEPLPDTPSPETPLAPHAGYPGLPQTATPPSAEPRNTGNPQNPSGPPNPFPWFPPIIPLPARAAGSPGQAGRDPATPPGSAPGNGNPDRAAGPGGWRSTGSTGSTSTTTTTTTNNSGGRCYYDFTGSQILAKQEQANNTLNVINNLLSRTILTKVNGIDNKLGAQLPNGGVGGILVRIFNSNVFQKTISLLTFVTTLHNAYMLSNAMTQTLFGAFDNILKLFKHELKDDKGEDIDTSKWVGNAVDGFFKGIFGVESVDGFKKEWKKYNRIYQSIANAWYRTQSIMFSIMEVLEVLGTYSAQIGNALRKWGVVGEDAYRAMNPNPNFTKLKWFAALYAANEAIEAIEQVTSELVNVQEESEELAKDKERIHNAVKGLDESGNPITDTEKPENEQAKKEIAESKIASIGEAVLEIDEITPEE